MNIVEVLNADWELMNTHQRKAHKHLKRYKAYLLITETPLAYIGIFLLIALIIILSVYIDPFKIEFFITWLFIPVKTGKFRH